MKLAFTIATANFLAQAKTVADSFLEHNPADKFVIILLDRLDQRIDSSFFHAVDIIPIDKLKIPFFDEMVNRYSIFELSNSLKPFCAEFLVNEFQHLDILLYLDSDLYFYGSVDELNPLLSKHNIVITPHFFTPLPADGIKQNERHFLNSGLYNAGFFAINKSAEAMKFLKWWQERMRTLCLVDVAKGLFVDQIWLNYVPIYFHGVYLLENRGYNVAYWNLHERQIKNEAGRYMVNNSVPLVFYHFSGYNVERSEILGRYQHRYNFENRPEMASLFDQYKTAVLKNKYTEFSKLTCFYNARKEPPTQKASSGYGFSRLYKRIKRKLLAK